MPNYFSKENPKNWKPNLAYLKNLQEVSDDLAICVLSLLPNVNTLRQV